MVGDFETEVIISPDKLIHQVANTLKNGEQHLVAAGGDGTVHLILNAIMQLEAFDQVTIGAVGLGSSNDFHKPFNPGSLINGIPVRVRFQNTVICDVIKINFIDQHGAEQTQYCLINASIGITAEGNALFNSGNRLISTLHAVSVDAAIIASALLSIFTFQDISCQLNIDNEEMISARISNLGVIKNPHFTGHLCYDTPIEPDDGVLGVNLCSGLTLVERIKMLAALHNHRFSELPKTQCWKAKKLSITSERSFALEMDGEVIQTDNVIFNVLPKRVRCCR